MDPGSVLRGTGRAAVLLEGYGAAMPQRLFVFLQMEFPWVLGPADGRYLLRSDEDGEAERVIVLETLISGRGGAREASGGRPSLLRRLGAGAVEVPATPEPTEVSTTRTTVIDPVPLAAELQARAWLDGLEQERELQATAAVINRVLHFHRIAAADPYVHEVCPAQAIALRAGWGEGEQVADGRWLHARELTAETDGRGRRGRLRGGRARASALRPQERMARLLGARGSALLCEELALRARLDLDQGRAQLAALELEQAMSLAVQELRSEDRQDLAIRVAELEQLQTGVVEQAQLARAGVERPPKEDVVEHALGRLEAALRARSATGFAR